MQGAGQKQPRSNEMKERLKGPRGPRSSRGWMGDNLASPASASAVQRHGTGPIQRTASKSKAGQAPNSIARDSTNSVHIVFCFYAAASHFQVSWKSHNPDIEYVCVSFDGSHNTCQ